LLALTAILITISYWRRTQSFYRNASLANVALFLAGIGLMGYQLKGYFAQ